MEIRCSFLGQYHARYQRNNKRCGFKNLRCFPHCGPNQVHHENGFCGGPIVLDVSLTLEGASNSKQTSALDRLRAWGEFDLRDGEPRFPVGAIFSGSDLSPCIRSEKERYNPLFESKSEKKKKENGKRFSFHSQKMGYHYGWIGNKHSSNQNHAFCVYLAMEVSPDRFQCVGVVYSCSFKIFCRRRHFTVSQEEKEELAAPAQEYILRHDLDSSGLLPIAKRTKVDDGPEVRVIRASRGQSKGETQLSKGKEAMASDDAGLSHWFYLCNQSDAWNRENLEWMLLNDEDDSKMLSSPRPNKKTWLGLMRQQFMSREFSIRLERSLSMGCLEQFRKCLEERTNSVEDKNPVGFQEAKRVKVVTVSSESLKNAFALLKALHQSRQNELIPASSSVSPASSYMEFDSPHMTSEIASESYTSDNVEYFDADLKRCLQDFETVFEHDDMLNDWF